MNKTELIAAMAENSGLTKKDCEAALAAFTGAVETAMKSGDKVQMLSLIHISLLCRGRSALSLSEVRAGGLCPSQAHSLWL